MLTWSHSVLAADYPSEIRGIWAGRAEFAGDNRISVARATCQSYAKNPADIRGDVIIFGEKKKELLGGYVDTTETNISVTQISPTSWKIVDKRYDDGEGEGKVGWRNVTYEIKIENNTLLKNEGGQLSRYERCSFTERSVSPSFDCAKARTADEKTICANAELSRADREVQQAYTSAAQKKNPQVEPKAREILALRRSCGSDVSCIRNNQQNAIKYYNGIAGLSATISEPRYSNGKTAKEPISSNQLRLFLKAADEARVCARNLNSPSRDEMKRYLNIFNELKKYPELDRIIESYTSNSDAKKDAAVALAFPDVFAITCQKRANSVRELADIVEQSITRAGSQIEPVTVASCGSGNEATGASDGIKFRRVYTNMPKQEFQNLEIPGIKINLSLCKAEFISQTKNKKCGEAVFGKDSKIEKLELSPCFFGAEELSYDAFNKAVSQSYKLSNLDCKTKSSYSESMGVVSLMECSGSQKSGEWISISGVNVGNLSLVIGSDAVGITLKAARRAEGERPRFD
jgi:hypothetical protein